ncbi:MAG: hypothetical protein HYZ28_03430 [Myxococcales bacterium]|nr:hypothetical protein [Myxococcales bacterium]
MRNLIVLLAVAVPLVGSGAELANNEFAKFKVKLGGFIYGAVHYDSNDTGNRPWLNAVSKKGDRDILSFDPYGTRVNLTIETNASEAPKAKGFFEIDWGPVTAPRIRHAYVTADLPALSITVGQTWLPFTPVGPDTYNPMWFFKQGNAYIRAPQVTVSRAIGPVKASASLTSASVLGGSITKGNGASGTYSLAESLNPTGLLQLGYPVMGKGMVSVTGGLGRVDASYSGTDSRPRTGAETAYLELAVSLPVSILNISGKAFYQKGAGMGSGVGQTLVILPSDNAAPVSGGGGFLSVKAAATPNISAAAYAGLDDVKDDVGGVNVPIRRNLTIGAQATYSVVDGAIIAIELERVATLNATATGEEEYVDIRPSLVGRYSF